MWNMWADRLFQSCADESFHPLGTISRDELKAEYERILAIEDEKCRVAQHDHLQEVLELRDKQLVKYKEGGTHSFKRALLEASKTIKAIGVRA